MARPDPPVFETIDGCPPTRGMVVNSRKPSVRLSTSQPIDSYDWELWQAGERIAFGKKVTTGITDGTCIEFTPTRKLRKGAPSEWTLPKGFFYPPFGARRTYRTETYAGHTDFSVDFNRGQAGDDEGDIVRAPAPGTVAIRNFRAPGTNGADGPGESDLLIQHRGSFATLYTHMKAVPEGLRPGTRVTLTQVLGRISDVGDAKGSHLHHAHYSRRKDENGFGRPRKMRIRGEPMEASVGDSSTRPAGWGKSGQDVRSPALRPQIRVRVRDRSADPPMSEWTRRSFVVALEPTEIPGCEDPGCGG